MDGEHFALLALIKDNLKLTKDVYTDELMSKDLGNICKNNYRETLQLRLILHYQLKQYKEVIDISPKVLKPPLSKQDYEKLTFMLGDSQYKLNQLDAAMKTLLKNLKHLQSLLIISTIQTSQKKYTFARQHLTRALGYFPEHFEIYKLLGDLEKDASNWELSLTNYKQYLNASIEASSAHPEVILSIAEGQIYLRNFQEAIDHINTSITHPSSRSLSLLAQSYIGLNDYISASIHITNALILDPKDPNILYIAAKCDIQQKNHVAARQKMDLCVKGETKSIDYLTLYGEILESEGLREEAEKQYLNCLAIDCYSEATFLRLAEYYYATPGKEEQAKVYLHKVIQAQRSSNSKYHYMLFVTYANLRDLPNLILMSDRYFLYIENDQKIIDYLAFIFYSDTYLQNWKKAIIYLQAIVKQTDQSPPNSVKSDLKARIIAKKNLAMIDYQSTKFASASQHLKNFRCCIQKTIPYEDHKTLFEVYYLQAMIEIQRGTNGKNISLAKRSLTSCWKYAKDSQSQAAIYSALSFSCYLNNEQSKATKYLYKAHNLHPNQPMSDYLSLRMLIFNAINEEEELCNDAHFALTKITENQMEMYKNAHDKIDYAIAPPSMKFLSGMLAMLRSRNVAALSNFADVVLLNENKPQLHQLIMHINQAPLLKQDAINATYFIAKIKFIQTDNAEAVQILVKLLKEHPDHRYGQMLYARLLFAQGDLILAESYAMEAVYRNSSLPYMHYIIAQSIQKKSSNAAVIPHLLMIRALNPAYANILQLLTYSCCIADKLEDSLRYSLIILQADPTQDLLLECLSLFKQLKLYERGLQLIEKFRTSVESDMACEILDVQAQFFLALKRMDEYKQTLDEYISKDDSDPIITLKLGEKCHEKGDYEEEVRVYENFIDKHYKKCAKRPLKKVYNELGIALLRLGKTSLAVNTFKKASALEIPVNSLQLNNVVLAFIAANKLQAASTQLEDSYKFHRLNENTNFLKGLLFQIEGDETSAVLHYKLSLSSDKFYAPTALNYASILMKNQMFGEAVETLIPSTQAYPHCTSLLYNLALGYLGLLQPTKVLELSKLILQKIQEGRKEVYPWQSLRQFVPQLKITYEDSALAAARNIISYKQLGLNQPNITIVNLLISHALRLIDIRSQIRHLEKCMKEDPNNYLYIFAYANALIAAGKTRLAIPHLKKCIELNPKKAALYYLSLANVYHKMLSTEQEINCLQHSIQATPTHTAYNNLGTLLFKIKQLGEAKKAFESSIKLSPDSADSNFNLANVYLHQQNFDAATAYYNVAIHNDSNHEAAISNLALIERLKRNTNIQRATK